MVGQCFAHDCSLKVLIWKVQYEIGNNEVGKLGPKLESASEVGNFPIKLETIIEIGATSGVPTSVTVFKVHFNFPTSAETFQLKWKLSNFLFFPIPTLSTTRIPF